MPRSSLSVYEHSTDFALLKKKVISDCYVPDATAPIFPACLFFSRSDNSVAFRVAHAESLFTYWKPVANEPIKCFDFSGVVKQSG